MIEHIILVILTIASIGSLLLGQGVIRYHYRHHPDKPMSSSQKYGAWLLALFSIYLIVPVLDYLANS